MYRILIADDHPLLREAMAAVIQRRFEEAQIYETEDLDSTLAKAEEEPDLDLILLDLNMPGMDGLNGIVKLRSTFPEIPVVVLSAEEDKNVVLQAMTYGAVGFITKSMQREKIADAINQILDGQAFLPPDIIRRADSEKNAVTHTRKSEIDPRLIASLTRRQLLVFERMAKGESNKQIGYELNIAETTVKAHVSAILRKLNVHSRIQAVLSASSIDFNRLLNR